MIPPPCLLRVIATVRAPAVVLAPEAMSLALAGAPPAPAAQAPNTKRDPVDERIVFVGISCMAIEMNVSPLQCIGIR